ESDQGSRLKAHGHGRRYGCVLYCDGKPRHRHPMAAVGIINYRTKGPLVMVRLLLSCSSLADSNAGGIRMKVRNWIAACALGVLTVAPAASAQTHTAAKVDDSAIKSRVEAKLKSADSLKNDHIVVSVDNGVVTLSGTVHSEAQRLRARQLAKVTGVTNVENKLEVDSKTEHEMDKAEAKTKSAAAKTKDA